VLKYLRGKIYRAIPTCTLWESEVSRWVWHFRPWPAVIVTEMERFNHMWRKPIVKPKL